VSSDQVGLGPPETFLPQHNVINYFTYWVERAPQRTALVFPQGRGPDGAMRYDAVTYADLDRDSSRVAHALARRGVEPGDRVLILVPMSRPLYTLILAVFRLGAAAVFLDPWVTLEQLVHAVDLTQPKVFCGIPKAHLLRSKRTFRKIPIKLVAQGGFFSRLLGQRLESLYARPQSPDDAPYPAAQRQPQDTTLITFTTGSTGTPKGSDRTQAFLNAQGLALDHHLSRLPGDVDMPALPVFPLNNMGAGVTSVIPQVDFKRIAEVDAAAVVEQVRDWKVTTIGGSPAYLEPIARHCQAAGITLPVRAVVTGGAPVTPDLLALLREVCPAAKGRIMLLYGSTEAEPVAHIEADEVLSETAALTAQGKGNCVGAPVDDVELKVVRARPDAWQLPAGGWDEVEVARGEVGEVLVTGEHVQKDYYQDPEAVQKNKVTGPDGRVWHRMGDLAYQDEKDRLWLVGRVTNAIARGDTYLYPIQVEALAREVDGVRSAGLVEVAEEVVLAVVCESPDGDAAVEEALRAACRASGAEVDAVRFVRALPVDPRHNAKIDYPKLREQLQAGAGK
jgi:acyl-CoA synthetase (AMP-forming)/AMP-acid ligase II